MTTLIYAVAPVTSVALPKPLRWQLGIYRICSPETGGGFACQSVFRCPGCITNMEVKADGYDQAEVELTSKRNGEAVAIKRMSVMPDRKSIQVVFEDKEGNAIMAFDVRKEPW